ncbi:MAG: outer membrane protein assembly factor BamA [Deltaproteobacteria bacterium]|nr:outer membrane protein assembly factor BamA [Deltaproteobacteria bacterium]MBI3077802.1 outer membrane protein assembly factor BamA [Deltaproteobacteria bacterium]
MPLRGRAGSLVWCLLGTLLVHGLAWGAEEVLRVSIRGNRRIEEDAIRLRIRTRAGQPYSAEAIREDIRRIFEMGFFTDIQVDLQETPGGIEITFIVQEKPAIKEVAFQGYRRLSLEDLQKAIDLRPGAFLDLAQIKANAEKIYRAYADKGYYAAVVEHRLETVEANQVQVVFQIRENERVYVWQIQFEGARAFTDRELRKVMETSTRGLFSWITGSGVLKQDVLDRDLDALTAYYLDHGYIQARVFKPRIDVSREGIRITIPVEEGRLFRVGRVELKGELIAPEPEIAQLLTLKSGEPFNRSQLRKDVDAIVAFYGNRGHAFASVTPETRVRDPEQAVDIAYAAQQGALARIGRITITGNSITRDKVIRRELRLAEGDRYNASLLTRSRQRVQNLGFFEETNLTTKPGEDRDTIDVNIQVKEAPTGRFTVGAGVGSESGFIVLAEIAQQNLFGRGQSLSLSGRLSGISSDFVLSFTEPWLFDIPLSAGADLFNTRREFINFNRDSKGGALRAGYPLTEFIRGTLKYRFEEIKIGSVAETAATIIREEEGKSTTSSLTAGAAHDTRDNVRDPRRGSLSSLSAEYAGSFLGGTNDFYKFIGSTLWYFPLPLDSVFSLAGRLGYAEAYRGRLRIGERFFAGGVNSVRGFRPGALGPRDPATGDVVGGGKELIVINEVIFPILPSIGLRGVVFGDAGNAFATDKGYDLGDLRYSAGAGVRWISPIGPLRFEYAIPFNRKPDEEKRNFIFTFGTFF